MSISKIGFLSEYRLSLQKLTRWLYIFLDQPDPKTKGVFADADAIITGAVAINLAFFIGFGAFLRATGHSFCGRSAYRHFFGSVPQKVMFSLISATSAKGLFAIFSSTPVTFPAASLVEAQQQ